MFAQLFDRSFLSKNGPLLGDCNSKAITERLQAAQLVHAKRASGQNPVVLEGSEAEAVFYMLDIMVALSPPESPEWALYRAVRAIHEERLAEQ